MAERAGIHFARFENSPRLQRFVDFMLHGEPRTTREINRGADVCAVNSARKELEKNGFDMRCIRRTRPAVYQLFDVDGARQLAARLRGKGI